MQEKLQRWFMRGAVNLNLEVMNVFREMPTTDNAPQPKPERGREKRSHRREDPNEFIAEPAPRIFVTHHHRHGPLFG
jgi:hypothetical protein